MYMEEDDKQEEKPYGEKVPLFNMGAICPTLMLAEAFHMRRHALVLH